MSISPKLAAYLNFAMFALLAASLGFLYVPSIISPATAKDIMGVCGGLAFLLNGFLHGYSSPTAGPLAGKAVDAGKTVGLALLGAVLGLALLHPTPAAAASARRTHAAAPLPAKRPVGSVLSDVTGKIGDAAGKFGLTGSATTDLNAALAKIQAISLADLEAAKADADATGDYVGSICYGAIADLVRAQQSVPSPAQNTDQPGAVVPTTHVVLTFQRGRDFVNALRPGSKISVGCAPLAEEVKMDVVTWMATVAAGTVSLASFGL